MFSKNPIFVVFLVLAVMSMTKMMYKNDSMEHKERISRICAALPQPHPDCPQ
jgi:hypothetical protein